MFYQFIAQDYKFGKFVLEKMGKRHCTLTLFMRYDRLKENGTRHSLPNCCQLGNDLQISETKLRSKNWNQFISGLWFDL